MPERIVWHLSPRPWNTLQLWLRMSDELRRKGFGGELTIVLTDTMGMRPEDCALVYEPLPGENADQIRAAFPQLTEGKG